MTRIARTHRSARQRGDTIIEVLLATTVFSAVAVGSLMVMNRSVAITQRALEITQVRNQIDTQAELIRYIHAMRTSGINVNNEWDTLKQLSNQNSNADIQPTALQDGSCRDVADLPHSFVVNPNTATVRSLDTATFLAPDTYAQYSPLDGKSYGLWVQGKYVNVSRSDNPDQRGAYIDFYIQACWNSVGSTVPVTLGTVVRLYDPTVGISAGNGE